MRVYFVRHGETDLNAQDRHQYHETPLSELGLEQARQVGERFSDIAIDHILTSSCMRAVQTAHAIQNHTHVEIEEQPNLIEIRRPSVFLGKPTGNDPEVDAIKKQIREHYHDPDWHHSDEENVYDVKKRALEFLRELEQREEHSLCVVSHGTMIRMIVALMLFGPEMSSHDFVRWHLFSETSNTGITLCEFSGQSWKLVSWNDAAHLS